jgi:hypothetical protein
MAERIRLSRAKGWRLPANAVSVARPGRFGNPFVVGRDGTRAQCAAKLFVLLAGLRRPGRSPDRRRGAAGGVEAAEAALDRRAEGARHRLLVRARRGSLATETSGCTSPTASPLPAWCRAARSSCRAPRIGMAIADLLELQRRSEAKVPAHG